MTGFGHTKNPAVCVRVLYSSKAAIGGTRPQMRTMAPKIEERTCSDCKGTGFPVVKQPKDAGRRIYPVKCVCCGGKGRITEVALAGRQLDGNGGKQG